MRDERGESAAVRIAPRAADAMRLQIEQAGGAEVFFAASLGEDRRIVRARVLARGHASAVPAILEGVKTREVVIHNHPSGNLEPSDADLDLASIYSQNGHGVYIVDNAVERVYAVVEPFIDEDRVDLDAAGLSQRFRPAGALARSLSGYEFRPQQMQMMEAIAEAFNHDQIAVIEAPTGVGKTLAYLVPAVEWATQNRERVVISTRTINLQEQIVFKDIPLLEQAMDTEVRAVLVKGRSNYVCPRRLDRALSEASLFEDENDRKELEAISAWAKQTKDGSKSDLSWVPSREIWERVCSESDTCTTPQCQAAGNCFVTRARREIAKADLLVVNHHMLFSDLAIKRELGQFQALGVLPGFRRLIIDEAHHVEDSATEYFGTEVTRNGAMALLGRFIRADRGRERGLIPFIKLKVRDEVRTLSRPEIDEILDQIVHRVSPAIEVARVSLENAFAAVRDCAAAYSGQIGRDVKWRLTPEVLAGPPLRRLHAEQVGPAVEDVHALAKQCAGLLTRLKSIQAGPDQETSPLSLEIAQLTGYRERLVRLGNLLLEGTSEDLPENTVRWIEIDARNPRIVRIVSCPLEVSKPLREWVYPNLRTVGMTSATLSVANDFAFYKDRVGLDGNERVEAVRLDSPFDFENQAVLGVVSDMPPPDAPNFLAESADCIGDILAETGGHAFVLFTSFFALTDAAKRLENRLRSLRIPLLRQGDAARTQLLERFRSDTASVLFGTDSFWEGVDVAGDALQCVILPRLPFRVPTEPVLQARAEAIEASGGNAFMDYTVPMAVIKFRQGVGRLIRRKTDRGSIVILDSRVISKHYGKTFLNSLPGFRVMTGPKRAVCLALREFHGRRRDQ